jgi:hypothetical protein
MNFHLIWNWNDSWKWISMQTAALVTVLNTSALAFPHEWAHYVQTASAVLGAATMYGRLIQQTPPGPGMPDRTIHVQAGETVGVKGPPAEPKP